MWKIKEAKWKRLDNAAKIFPALAGREDSEVFRIACTLHEDVDPALLQSALDAAVEEHPSFTDTIRAGLFWYYLEPTRLRPKVHEETEVPLQPLYDEGHGLLIDISYYKKRINLEIFHAIADGTGAFIFFRSILANYLALAHPEELRDVPIERFDSTEREKTSDGFTEYFEPEKGSSTNFAFLGSRADKTKVYRFSEPRTPDCRQLVTEGVVSVAQIKRAAKAEGATITEFICALLIQSIHSVMPRHDYGKTIRVAVPVNLRNYFSSNTMRNFFGMIEVQYNFSAKGPHELSDIIRAVKAAFEHELTRENMEQKIASQVKMERHPIVRMCPLVLKDWIMNLLQSVSMRRRTICLSNVGRIEIQPELAGYIAGFDVFNSSSKRQVCMCSFGDVMTITFSGVLAEHDVERAFFRSLAGYDSAITISTNYSAKEFE
ncbi:MAG: hypothetical protein ACI4V1_07505 [Eubacteriales bacterium]